MAEPVGLGRSDLGNRPSGGEVTAPWEGQPARDQAGRGGKVQGTGVAGETSSRTGSANRREVVILRSLHELDWNAIGEKTGRSPDAARMLWARAMQRVGGLLKGSVS